MIGKIPKPRKDGKSSFKALINYCLGVTGHSEGYMQENKILTTSKRRQSKWNL